MSSLCYLSLALLACWVVAGSSFKVGPYEKERRMVLNAMRRQVGIPQECMNQKIDLVFVVDSSNSICPVGVDAQGSCRNWRLVQGFIWDIVKVFNVQRTRVGLVLFGEDGEVQWTLDGYVDESDLRSKIGSLPYLNQWTNIAGGIRKMRQDVFKQAGDRGDAANVAIVITDGQPNVEKENTFTESEMSEADGVLMFSIGITKEVDESTLMKLSSPPHEKDSDYFMTPDFKGLDQILKRVIESTCTKPTPPPSTPAPVAPAQDCEEADIDLVFVVDSSNSICPMGVPHGGWCENWLLMRNFLKDIVNMLPIGDTKARVGLVLFGHKGEVQFELDAHNTKAGIIGAIDELPYLNEWTNIADGVRKMRTQVFSRRGDRPGVMNVGIIITDGNPNVEPENTMPEVARAMEAGITLFSVGITREIHEPILQGLSSPPQVMNQNYFMTPDFEGLRQILGKVVKSTCTKPTGMPIILPSPTPIIECRDVEFDMTFVVDGSNSICPVGVNSERSCAEWELMKSFLGNIVNMLPLGNGQARVALVLFGDLGHVQWELDEYVGSSARTDLLARINDLPYLNEWTNIADGIRKMRKGVFTRRGDRAGAQNVAIVITDGQPNKEVDETVPQANMAMDEEGITMFSVGITNDVSETTLKSLCNEPKKMNTNYFMSPDFDSLEDILKKAVISICENVNG